MSLTEVIAVLFSLLCIGLAVRKHILNWPAGLIGVSAYFILFLQVRLYADMVLQVVFFIQGAWGWYHWTQKGPEDSFEVLRLSPKKWISYAGFILSFTLLWAWILYRYTQASLPLADAFVATLSLTANWLMAKKYLENWLLWILADFLYILLFLYKELYLSAAIYGLFLLLAIKGYLDWKKLKHTAKASS